MSWIFRVAVFGGLVFGAAGCEGQSPIVGASEAAELSEEGPDFSTSDVGAPCLPTDEWQPGFAGFGVDEVNLDSNAPSCRSKVCVVHGFQGRVSCPYGQAEPNTDCFLPGLATSVNVPVEPQLFHRPPEVASICSCRCDGPGPGPFCSCPEGMECVHLVDDLGLGWPQLTGSYCLYEGSMVAPDAEAGPVCEQGTEHDCGSARPY